MEKNFSNEEIVQAIKLLFGDCEGYMVSNRTVDGYLVDVKTIDSLEELMEWYEKNS